MSELLQFAEVPAGDASVLDEISARGALDDVDLIARAQRQDIVRAVVAAGDLPVREEILRQDLHLIARAQVAAKRKLLSAAQHAHLAVAPADVVRMFALFLIALHARLWKGIVGEERKIPVLRAREHERVELAVVLEHAAAVDRDDAPLAVDDRVRVHDVLMVEHDRPVADDQPLVEAPGAAEEIVVLDQLGGGVRRERLVRVHARVGEEEAFALDGVGQRGKEGCGIHN